MISFRPIQADDFPLLLDWLQRPHVKQWWDDGDDTIARVARNYSSDPETTKRFIATLDGSEIGYLQFIRLDKCHVGTDQFLADHDRLGKGLGTQCLRAFMNLIIAREAPDMISVDPHPNNRRAIRCYEKCGFVRDAERSSATVCFMILDCRTAR